MSGTGSGVWERYQTPSPGVEVRSLCGGMMRENADTGYYTGRS
jgi:hypothetical protein